MAERAWQQSLRRSTGEIERFKPLASRRILPLKSIDEDVFDENDNCKPIIKPEVHRRQRLSTKESSVSDITDIEKENKSRRPSVTKSPTKKDKASSFLTKFPPPKLKIELCVDIPKALPSPIPLPAGVINIDPDDDSTLTYGREVMQYVNMRDAALRLAPEDILKDDPLLADRRERLTEWLIEIAHYFKCSQDTLYHSINLLDRALAIKTFRREVLQLVGITCFLIATKLDEYYPAEVEKLCYLTDNSFTISELRAMEMHILRILDFKAYGIEPMAFVQRFINAAHRSSDIFFYETTILFMDCLVPNVTMWNDRTCRKAASAILAALILHDGEKKTIADVWNPNMVYYVWPSYKELLPTVKHMYKVLIRLLREENRSSSLCIKYFSESRHNGLLSKSCISLDKVKAALAYTQLL